MGLIHGTCVQIAGVGVLIRGPSGAGKSDLALRLIDGGAELVADDYCEAAAASGGLRVKVPATIAGKLEVRGYGIVRLPHAADARVGLVVDLKPAADIPRLPEADTCTIEGVTLPCIAVDGTMPSAAARVRLAVRALSDNIRVSP